MSWLGKFLSGLVPGFKPFGEWIGKILYVVAIVLFVSLATNVWEKFFPPKPDTQIENIGTYYAEPKPDVAGIGCSMWRAYIKAGIKSR